MTLWSSLRTMKSSPAPPRSCPRPQNRDDHKLVGDLVACRLRQRCLNNNLLHLDFLERLVTQKHRDLGRQLAKLFVAGVLVPNQGQFVLNAWVFYFFVHCL